MGDVTSLIAALGLLDSIRADDDQKNARNFRQEEVFVPFKLPPLRQEQEISQSTMVDMTLVDVATCVS